jgi:hypothetical protein
MSIDGSITNELLRLIYIGIINSPVSGGIASDNTPLQDYKYGGYMFIRRESE